METTAPTTSGQTGTVGLANGTNVSASSAVQGTSGASPLGNAGQLGTVGLQNGASESANSASQGIMAPAPNPVSTQSTTTLSSDKSADVAAAQNTTANLQNSTGATTDPTTGVTTNANGTAVQPPVTTTAPTTDQNGNPVQNPSTTANGGYLGDVYYPPGSTVPVDQNGNPQALSDMGTTDQGIMSDIATMKAQVDSNTAATISGLQSSYANLISLQNQANQYANSSVAMQNIRSGTSHYEAATSASLMQANMSYGVQKINSLQSQENAAIQAAVTAGQNQDFKLMEDMNTEAASVRTEKQTAAAALAKTVANAATLQAQENFTAAQNAAANKLKQEQIDQTTAAQAQTAKRDPAVNANARAQTNLDAIKTDIAEKTFNATYGAFVGADGTTANSNPSSIPGYTQLANGTSVINSSNLPTGIDKESSIGGLPVIPAANVQTVKNLSSLAMTAAQLQTTFAAGIGEKGGGSLSSSMENQQNYTAMATAFNGEIANLAKSPNMANLSGITLPTGNGMFGGLFGGNSKGEFINAIKQINQALTTIIPGYSAPPYGQVFSTPQAAQSYFTSAGMTSEYTSEVSRANALAQSLYGRNANDGEIMQIINGQ